MARIARIIALLLLLASPASGQSPSPCLIEGDPIHWIADLCMSRLETDDEIAAIDCIHEELTRTFSDDCAAKRHYKRALCELALVRGTVSGDLASCLENREFVGPTVRKGGVGH